MHTERTMLDALHRRYRQFNGDSDRWVRAEHVRNGTGFYGWVDDPAGNNIGPLRTADFLAIDMWESAGHHIIGHEVKISRSDWRRELAEPEKAEAWARYCDEWYVVAPTGMIDRTELPEGWGLITVGDTGGTRMSVRSKRPAPLIVPRPIHFGILRAVQTTAHRNGARYTRTGDTP
jgi:hypothetical protein